MTNLLLTGGAGFIGGHLCRYILENTDWTVTVLDRIDEAGTLGRIADKFGPRCRFFWHDLKAVINPVMVRDSGQFDYVAHLAAGSHVDRSVRDPVSFVADNAMGTAHLLEYVRHHQPQAKTLYFSTDEVFGPAPPGVTFDEHSRHEPHNPYAASKAAGEALCPAWANTYGMPIVVTHCTNVVGPGQYGEKFVPLCARLIGEGATVQIHARGGVPASRYYVHVSDVCRAVLAILTRGGVIRGPESGRYNISGTEEHSNLLVAQTIAKLLGKELRHELVENAPNRPRPDMRYAIAGSKLAALGWAPRVGLESALADCLGIRLPVNSNPVESALIYGSSP